MATTYRILIAICLMLIFASENSAKSTSENKNLKMKQQTDVIEIQLETYKL